MTLKRDQGIALIFVAVVALGFFGVLHLANTGVTLDSFMTTPNQLTGAVIGLPAEDVGVGDPDAVELPVEGPVEETPDEEQAPESEVPNFNDDINGGPANEHEPTDKTNDNQAHNHKPKNQNNQKQPKVDVPLENLRVGEGGREGPTFFIDVPEHELVYLEDIEGNKIGYELESFEDRVRLYSDVVADFFEVKALGLESVIVIDEHGIVTDRDVFIQSFTIDITKAAFGSISYTKSAEGTALYKCINFDRENENCDDEWKLIGKLSLDEEYSLTLTDNKATYAELKPLKQQSLAAGSTSPALGITGALNTTDVGGLVFYEERNNEIPQYRNWHVNDSYSDVKTAQTAAGADLTWELIRANHERDEMVAGTIDKDNDITIQVYDGGAGTWGNLVAITNTTENSAYRSLDIAYEGISGDALIVFENDSTGADNDVAYTVWNGTGYATTQQLDSTLVNGEFRWIETVPRRGTNQIMVLMHNDLNDLYAILWNGTDFDSSLAITASTGTTSNTEQHFSYAWESQSGQGLLFYGETDLTYRTFDPVGGFGGTENTISGTGAVDSVRSCSNSKGDEIGFIWQDSGNDVNMRVWDGSTVLGSPPSQDAQTENAGTNNDNIDCAWINSTTTIFSFVDKDALSMDYVTFTKANTWSHADLTSTSNTGNFASDDIKGLRLTSHPTSEKVMIIAQDIAEDITAILLNRTDVFTIAASPLDAQTEVGNGAQESAQFDWHRFDPPPNVTGIEPNGNSVGFGVELPINATVVDNILISVVVANITLPNGTVDQVTLRNVSGNNTFYNGTYTIPTLGGEYTVAIFANDSSVHQNVNDSESTTFTTSDTTNPNVTDLLPTKDAAYNITNVIEVAATVVDDGSLDAVVANITLANGTIVQLALADAGSNKFNTSYTVPPLIGDYNITFAANDTSNNLNASEQTNFTVSDKTNPNVTSSFPQPNTAFNVSQTIEIAVNVTDQVNISVVTANITQANGTIVELTLTETGGLPKFNASYTITNLTGNYNVTFVVNDTSNNLNYSEQTNFTVNDVVNPNITINTPLDASNHPQDTNISVAITVKDDVQVSDVIINVTVPNGTIVSATLTDIDFDGIFNVSYNDTNAIGTYTLEAFANDTNNNINNSEVITFTTQDSGSPLTVLVSPANNTVQASSTVTYVCNATDTVGLSNVTLFHNLTGTFTGNQTNTTFGNTGNQTSFGLANVPDGTHVWNCEVNDTSNNGAFASANYTLHIDTTPPSVTSLVPTTDATFSTSQEIGINATVTDAFTISTVLANITLANGSVEELTMVDDDGDNIYNVTFTIPALNGDYNITFLANDTSNNVNTSERTNFTVSDSQVPTITTVTCGPKNITLNQTIECNATVTDDILLDSVFANVTLPNGSTQVQTITNITSVYNFTFQEADIVGEHTINWVANDSSDNQGTGTGSFNVSDVTAPLMTINGPANMSNTSATSISFNFTADDNYYPTLNCSLHFNGSVNTTVAAALDQISENVTITGFNDGSHIWNVSCSDNSTNTNISETRYFIVDTINPTFEVLNTSPKLEDDLDPDVNITIIANVTDNTTNVQSVIFQYKLHNDTVHTNVTMDYTAADLLYNTSFNATRNGTYSLRVFANDSAGNSDFSNYVNISVLLDKSWTRAPASFGTLTSAASVNLTLGNLTINNTGDYALHFNITSDSNDTFFNDTINTTTNFTLNAGTVKVIAVNESAPTGGLETINISIAINDTNANITADYTAGSIVVAPGQPVIQSTFTTPNDPTKTVTQGDSAVAFTVKVDNIGEGNATNVTSIISIPDGWNLSFGTLNNTIGDIDSGDNEEHTIEVDIPTTSSAGTFTIIANATGYNTSNTELGSIDLIFVGTVDVTVNSQTTTLGGSSDSSSSGGGGSSGGHAVSSGGSSTSAGGGGGGAPTKTVEIAKKVVSVTRGTQEIIPVIVANVESDTRLTNVRLELEGFLAQYITISPSIIPSLEHLESDEFTLTLFVPSYFAVDEYPLTVRIIGDSILLNADNIVKRVEEIQEFVLKVEGASGNIVIPGLNASEATIQQMKELGFPTEALETLLAEARRAIENEEYTKAKELLEQIDGQKKNAFAADELMEKVQEGIENANSKLLDTPQTEEALQLAHIAFQRGDFTAALDRVKNAELMLLLETKGRVNMIWFVKTYWWALILGSLLALILGRIVYKRGIVFILKRRIHNLNKEESTIANLLKEAQKKYLKEGSLSEAQYDRYVSQYKERLTKIRQLRIKLRNKRVLLLKTKDELHHIRKEKVQVHALLKRSQKAYLIKGKISRDDFMEISKRHQERFTEIEQEESILEEKMSKEKEGAMPLWSHLFRRKKATLKRKSSKKKRKTTHKG